MYVATCSHIIQFCRRGGRSQAPLYTLEMSQHVVHEASGVERSPATCVTCLVGLGPGGPEGCLAGTWEGAVVVAARRFGSIWSLGQGMERGGSGDVSSSSSSSSVSAAPAVGAAVTASSATAGAAASSAAGSQTAPPAAAAGEPPQRSSPKRFYSYVPVTCLAARDNIIFNGTADGHTRVMRLTMELQA